jgi:signal-transduction protein with cAMP-binding, CBS, and nucleotidyltransferase domain
MLVGPAMTTMLDKRVHCLPVIEDGKPCGMLTSSDLLIALQCALQLLAKASVCGPQP